MLPHKLNEYAPGVSSNTNGGSADYQVSCDTSSGNDGWWNNWGEDDNNDYWSQWANAGGDDTTVTDKLKDNTVCEPEEKIKNTGTAPTGCGVSIDMDKFEDVMFVPNGIDHTNIDQYDVVVSPSRKTGQGECIKKRNETQ